MSDSHITLPVPSCWISLGFEPPKNAITLCARTSSRVAHCPTCGKRFARIHSRYTRMLDDLPGQVAPITVRLRVRSSFATARPAAQRSSRNGYLVSPHTTVAEPSGSTAASRTSPLPSEGKRGLLLRSRRRRLRRQPAQPHLFAAALGPPSAESLGCGGLFAFRRGPRYRTGLVDLKRHALVDIVPDRSVDGFARWLGEHLQRQSKPLTQMGLRVDNRAVVFRHCGITCRFNRYDERCSLKYVRSSSFHSVSTSHPTMRWSIIP